MRTIKTVLISLLLLAAFSVSAKAQAVYGSISGLIEMIIVGAIVGAIYKPGSARKP